MKASEKNRDPERAAKRAVTDARCAWRKMSPEARTEFIRTAIPGLIGPFEEPEWDADTLDNASQALLNAGIDWRQKDITENLTERNTR
jgi:hypothetical protein